MDDLLLLIHGLLKVALVVSVMVLVATAPPTASAAVADQDRAVLRSITAVGAWADHRDGDAAMDGAFADSDIFDAGRWPTDQADFPATVRHDREPDHWRQDGDCESHRSYLVESDPFEHATNVDGTPMGSGGFDLHGNAYGITDFHCDSWGGGMASMFD